MKGYNMEELFIYLLSVLDSLQVIAFLSVVFFIVAGCILITHVVQNPETFDKDEKGNFIEKDCYSTFKRWKKITIISGLVCLFFCFVPSKTTVLLMSGVHYGKKVVTNERVEKINKLIDLEIDKRLGETK